MKINFVLWIIFAFAVDAAIAADAPSDTSKSATNSIPVYRNLTLKQGSDIMDAMDGNIYAFWNSTIGTDIYTC
jgi:hypothetical protein